MGVAWELCRPADILQVRVAAGGDAVLAAAARAEPGAQARRLRRAHGGPVQAAAHLPPLHVCLRPRVLCPVRFFLGFWVPFPSHINTSNAVVAAAHLAAPHVRLRPRMLRHLLLVSSLCFCF